MNQDYGHIPEPIAFVPSVRVWWPCNGKINPGKFLFDPGIWAYFPCGTVHNQCSWVNREYCHIPEPIVVVWAPFMAKSMEKKQWETNLLETAV